MALTRSDQWDGPVRKCNTAVLTNGNCGLHLGISIAHFTVACFVACPLNESEAGADLVLLISRNLHKKSSNLVER